MPNPTTIPAFPDFDVATLPALPDGFEDASFANDACPSFQHDDLGMILYVDYADAAQREHPEAPRFSLHFMDWSPNGWVVPEVYTEANSKASEDFAEIEEAVRVAITAGLIDGCKRVYRRGDYYVTDSSGGPDWEEGLAAFDVFDDEDGHHGSFTTLEAAKAYVDAHGTVE